MIPAYKPSGDSFVEYIFVLNHSKTWARASAIPLHPRTVLCYRYNIIPRPDVTPFSTARLTADVATAAAAGGPPGHRQTAAATSPQTGRIARSVDAASTTAVVSRNAVSTVGRCLSVRQRPPLRPRALG